MKPKGKTPSLLVQSTGKPFIDTFKRRTKCTRCKGDIVAGQKCFKIPKTESGHSHEKPCCVACMILILEQTKKDLLVIEDSLASINL